MGFGHRVYKNYDPRARIMQKTTHEVLNELGIKDDPLLDVAIELEQIALKDEYFIEKKLYPNIDFYSGITLKAMGFPTSMFTVLFALARTVGWIAQWKEMIEDPSQRIGRPRQLYIGEPKRDYLTIAQRGWIDGASGQAWKVPEHPSEAFAQLSGAPDRILSTSASPRRRLARASSPMRIRSSSRRRHRAGVGARGIVKEREQRPARLLRCVPLDAFGNDVLAQNQVGEDDRRRPDEVLQDLLGLRDPVGDHHRDVREAELESHGVPEAASAAWAVEGRPLRASPWSLARHWPRAGPLRDLVCEVRYGWDRDHQGAPEPAPAGDGRGRPKGSMRRATLERRLPGRTRSSIGPSPSGRRSPAPGAISARRSIRMAHIGRRRPPRRDAHRARRAGARERGPHRRASPWRVRAPGPDGGADVVDDPNMRRALAHGLGDAVGEIGRIDDDQELRLRLHDGLGGAPDALEDRRQLRDHGRKPMTVMSCRGRGCSGPRWPSRAHRPRRTAAGPRRVAP